MIKILVVLAIIVGFASATKGQDEGNVPRPSYSPNLSDSKIKQKIEANSKEIKELIGKIDLIVGEIKQLELKIKYIIDNREKITSCAVLEKLKNSTRELMENKKMLSEQTKTSELEKKLSKIDEELAHYKKIQKDYIDYLKKEKLDDCSLYEYK